MPLTARDDRFDPPTPSLAIVKIDAGAGVTETNVVPDAVTIVVDRRLLPGEDLDDVIAAMESLVAETVREPFRAEVRVVKAWPPCATPADQLVSRAAVAATRTAGLSGEFGMDQAANDTSWFVAAGIPAILLGPGDPTEAHATDESLDIAQFRQAIDVFAALCLAVIERPAIA
jgi:acetylornithine deacetylase/succinyl-diaminopimelate desuccinylase-like protein